MPLTPSPSDLTYEVYQTQRRPYPEYGVAFYRDGLEVYREEEFWTPEKVDRAIPRILAELTQPNHYASAFVTLVLFVSAGIGVCYG